MSFGLFFVYILFFAGLLYVLLVLPQRRRTRAQERMLGEMKSGDEVVTVGGLFGRVVDQREEKVELEVSKGVRVKVATRAIGQIVSEDQVEGTEQDSLSE